MKAGWERKPLKSILTLEYGKPLEGSERNANGLYPVYGANGIKSRSDKYYYDAPSIIIGRKGSVGEINFSEDKFWPLDVTYFVKYDSNKHDLRFLYYLLTTLNLPKLGKGVKPGINRNDIYSKKVETPPLPEQERIVKILDETFEGIAIAKANAEKNLQNARALFESHLNAIFLKRDKHWQVKPLQMACIIKPLKSEARKQLSSTDLVSFTRMENLGINQKFFSHTQTKNFSEVVNSYTYFSENDVLLAKITPCFENGKLGIAKNLVNGIGFGSSEFLVLRPTSLIKPEWLYYFLSRESFRIEGAKQMSGAVGHKRISKEFIENYSIPIPPLPEQEQIVRQLDALSNHTRQLESHYQKKIALLDELKQSLLHQAFSGNL
jgi:type I restriction enzyme, S subunit